MPVEHYPFVGVNVSADLFKKFAYMCAKKNLPKSKVLLSLIMAFTKNVTMEEVDKFYADTDVSDEK